MTFQNSKTDCQGVGLRAICNVDVPEFRLLSLSPPPPAEPAVEVRACVFASLFSSVKVLCVRVRALSLRSLTRPWPSLLAEPMAASHSTAPCQLSGSMSNLYE